MSTSPTTPTSTSDLPPRYDAAAVQQAVAAVWESENAFHAEPDPSKEPYSIVIPPPNVTAALHLGHALNNTIQDILIRRARMQGKNTVWVPGTDHAGIATQAVVEKRLLQQGIRRRDMGRETFVQKVQEWKDEYEAKILAQLKAMGCSCDFERVAFTMDEPRAKAVREAFFRLFKDGLIYRGKRLVNWDPVLQTALADDEVENEEIDGHFYYLKYPLVPTTRHEREYVVVATTRPETMLGDTAVGINPKDPRAAALRGMSVHLPIVGRVIPIIEDDYVMMPGADDPKAAFATGFLKVTPAHDPNDWDIGQRHGLPVINVFAPDASISKDHGWTDFPTTTAASQRDAGQPEADLDFLNSVLGKSREDARKLIVDWFKSHGLLEAVKPYRHSVGHGDRSHVPIEPYLSDQWYIAVQKPIPWLPDAGVVEGTTVPKNSLAGLALTALDTPTTSITTSRNRQEAESATPIPNAHTTSITTSRDRQEAESATPIPDAHTTSVTTSRDRQEAESATPIPDAAHPSPATDHTYLLTFTTRGTRLHGDARGSVHHRNNLPGTPLEPANPELVELEQSKLAGEPAALDRPRREGVQSSILEVCAHRGWTLHALHVRTDHVHAVISADDAPEKVMTDLKAYATRRLRADGLVDPDEAVWTRHGSTRWLNEPASVEAAVRYVVHEQGAALEPGPIREEATGIATSRVATSRVATSRIATSRDREGAESAQPIPPGNTADTAHTADDPARATPVPLPDGRGSLPALSGVLGDDALTFVPERYAKTYWQWNASLRDWCISRQLWWGHRIPVWGAAGLQSIDQDTADLRDAFAIGDDVHPFHRELNEQEQRLEPGTLGGVGDRYLHSEYAIRSSDSPSESIATEAGLTQDPDVLDTWFSSALWPMSTLGWPERTPDLLQWNPTSVLCTAREIITLWVSRMVMFNRYMLGHPDESTTSRDREGAESAQPMSGEPRATQTRPAGVALPDGRASSSRNLPFHAVFIHAMIQDGHGQKMSKSLGNGVDPLDIIDSHGADAMRFTLAQMTTHTQDVRLPVDLLDPHTGETFTPLTFTNKSGYTVFKPIQTHKGKPSVSPYGVASGEATATPDMPAARTTSSKFDLGRNFCNKLWNASRFVISNLNHHGGTEARSREGKEGIGTEQIGEPASAGGSGSVSGLSTIDKWILSRLASTVRAVDEALSEYRFDRYATACYDFFWRDFCDWYVESTKPRMRMRGPDADTAAQVLATCLDVSLRLMQPMIPFATERLWWALNEVMPERGISGFDCPPSERCISAAWPSAEFSDSDAEARVGRVQEIVEAIRRVRSENKVEPKRTVPVMLVGDVRFDDAERSALELWAGCNVVNEIKQTDGATASASASGVEIHVLGVVDQAGEAQRVEKERADLQKQITTLQGRLANKGYTDRAPAHLVQQTRDELASAEAELAKVGR